MIFQCETFYFIFFELGNEKPYSKVLIWTKALNLGTHFWIVEDIFISGMAYFWTCWAQFKAGKMGQGPLDQLFIFS